MPIDALDADRSLGGTYLCEYIELSFLVMRRRARAYGLHDQLRPVLGLCRRRLVRAPCLENKLAMPQFEV